MIASRNNEFPAVVATHVHSHVKINAYIHDKELCYFLKYSSDHGTPRQRSNLKKLAYYLALSGKTIFPLIFGTMPPLLSSRVLREHDAAYVRINKWNRALSLRFDWIVHDRTRRTSREEVINRRVYWGETYLRVLAPADSTYDLIPRDNATRHVPSSRDPAWPADFLRLHFRLSHG